MTTETVPATTPTITSETFNLFRAAVRANNPYTLTEKAGVKWPVSASRMLYLAYGFIRGIPYRVMEPTARPLFDKMGHSETTFLKGLATLITFAGVSTTPEDLKGWMAVPETPERAEKRARREAASKAIRAAKREAHKVPKLTVIVRTDLGSGPRVAQAVHGARLFAAEHTQIEHEWYTGSNTIVILEAKDEAHLTELADKADYWDVPWSMFREPDLQNQATCLVLAPSPVTRKLCHGLPLVA